MQGRILEKSKELFLDLGFKTVTMDDIARNLSISKKTIYVHFKNKDDLVEKVTTSIFNVICVGIDTICKEENYGPIEELYEIRNFVKKHLKDEKSSPLYQLQKYYPKIYYSLRKKQFELLQGNISKNLIRGTKLNVYRKEIHIEFISVIYLYGLQGIRDNNLFPIEQFPQEMLGRNFFEYHLRGICTKKGTKILENLLKKSNRENQ